MSAAAGSELSELQDYFDAPQGMYSRQLASLYLGQSDLIPKESLDSAPGEGPGRRGPGPPPKW